MEMDDDPLQLDTLVSSMARSVSKALVALPKASMLPVREGGEAEVVAVLSAKAPGEILQLASDAVPNDSAVEDGQITAINIQKIRTDIPGAACCRVKDVTVRTRASGPITL